MERIAVTSSNILSIGYEASAGADLGIMEIMFQGGRLYRYRDVPKALHAELMRAESIGRFFRHQIAPAFIGERVVPAEPVADNAKAG
jgi:hypothetical protein